MSLQIKLSASKMENAGGRSVRKRNTQEGKNHRLREKQRRAKESYRKKEAPTQNQILSQSTNKEPKQPNNLFIFCLIWAIKGVENWTRKLQGENLGKVAKIQVCYFTLFLFFLFKVCFWPQKGYSTIAGIFKNIFWEGRPFSFVTPSFQSIFRICSIDFFRCVFLDKIASQKWMHLSRTKFWRLGPIKMAYSLVTPSCQIILSHFFA